MNHQNTALPPVPALDLIKYKHYYITRDKSNQEKYHLILLEYEPEKLELSDRGDPVAYQKYGMAISSRPYYFEPESGEWRYWPATAEPVQGPEEFLDSLCYHNFTVRLEDSCREPHPYGNDQLVPPPELVFPALPQQYEHTYKHYYITQDKHRPETYYLHLLEYEPVRLEVDEKEDIIGFQTYGYPIRCMVYYYTPGQAEWRYWTGSDRIQSFDEFDGALIHNNFPIDLAGCSYEPGPYPGDGLVPAPETCFPPVPDMDQIRYKHYFITRNRVTPERYYLYLIKYEPAAIMLDHNDRLVAYNNYGTLIDSTTYYYYPGQEEWKYYYGSYYMAPYSDFDQAMIYNNFTMDLGMKWYRKNPYPGDGVSAPARPDFPPIPGIAGEEEDYRHYIVTQDIQARERYCLYLLKDAPEGMQATDSGGDYAEFLNQNGEPTLVRAYLYYIGDTEWRRYYNTFRVPAAEINRSLVYSNFDLAVTDPRTGSDLIRQPANAWPGDGIGIGSTRNGWTEVGNKWYYYVNGEKQTGEHGWLHIPDHSIKSLKTTEADRSDRETRATYYVLRPMEDYARGRNQLVRKEGDAYYLSSTGRPITGVWSIFDDVYCFDEDGKYSYAVSAVRTYRLSQDLRIKNIPSQSGTDQASLNAQDIVEVVIPKEFSHVEGISWQRVYSGSGRQTGWIDSRHLKRIDTEEAKYEPYQVWFSGDVTDEEGTKLAHLSGKQEVQVVLPVERNSTLVKLWYDNQFAWYEGGDLKRANCYVSEININICKFPSRWCEEIVGTFHPGDQVEFPLGVNLVEEDGVYWIQVYVNKQGGTGWVRRVLLTTEGSGDVETFIRDNGISVIEVANREKQVTFMNSILKGSVSEYLRTGIPWQVTMAQAAMETGWGEKTPIDIYTAANSNNIFGIKYTGSPVDNSKLYVRCWTSEHIQDSELSYWKGEHARWAMNGEALQNTGERDKKGKLIIKVIQPFRAYISSDESIIAHSKTLDNGYYDDAMQYKNDPYKFLEAIAPIYATDSSYFDNGKSIMDKYLDWNGK